jgi:hypothetical protein
MNPRPHEPQRKLSEEEADRLQVAHLSPRSARMAAFTVRRPLSLPRGSTAGAPRSGTQGAPPVARLAVLSRAGGRFLRDRSGVATASHLVVLGAGDRCSATQRCRAVAAPAGRLGGLDRWTRPGRGPSLDRVRIVLATPTSLTRTSWSWPSGCCASYVIGSGRRRCWLFGDGTVPAGLRPNRGIRRSRRRPPGGRRRPAVSPLPRGRR